ncbi:MAG: hypothetical protein LBL63_02345 [Clostridiales Family XIII bacterium]|jgi:hypothetical protein|nr:hypothetical protein [Clostridiales Family XIII bacterium]
MSILGGVNGFIEQDSDYLLLAFTNEEIGSAESYRTWWAGFSDVAAVPGLSGGIRVITERDQRRGQRPKWRYMVAFGFSGDADRLKNIVKSHVRTDDSALWLYEAIGPMTHKVWDEGDAEEHFFMALTNPVPGRELEYTEWYNRHHIPDIVSVSVYRSGRRFHIAAYSGAEPYWKYMAFYRFVGPALDMHGILADEVRRREMKHSEDYEEGDGAWIYSGA